tara:strand:- start:2241 stop:3266 length:1026 start_codon:yes stop_codon:yes gene_type:complete
MQFVKETWEPSLIEKLEKLPCVNWAKIVRPDSLNDTESVLIEDAYGIPWRMMFHGIPVQPCPIWLMTAGQKVLEDKNPDMPQRLHPQLKYRAKHDVHSQDEYDVRLSLLSFFYRYMANAVDNPDFRYELLNKAMARIQWNFLKDIIPDDILFGEKGEPQEDMQQILFHKAMEEDNVYYTNEYNLFQAVITWTPHAVFAVDDIDGYKHQPPGAKEDRVFNVEYADRRKYMHLVLANIQSGIREAQLQGLYIDQSLKALNNHFRQHYGLNRYAAKQFATALQYSRPDHNLLPIKCDSISKLEIAKSVYELWYYELKRYQQWVTPIKHTLGPGEKRDGSNWTGD